MIQSEIVNDYDKVYNYVVDGIVLGYVEFRIIDGVLDIINVFVDEESRKQGIATALLNKMIKEEDYRRIMLEVNENNKEAIRLYNSLGFTEINLRERYYGQDTAIIMEREK